MSGGFLEAHAFRPPYVALEKVAVGQAAEITHLALELDPVLRSGKYRRVATRAANADAEDGPAGRIGSAIGWTQTLEQSLIRS